MNNKKLIIIKINVLFFVDVFIKKKNKKKTEEIATKTPKPHYPSKPNQTSLNMHQRLHL